MSTIPMSPANVAAHAAASYVRTSPLPVPAAEALARLERAFLPPDVVCAVTRYEVATARYDELETRPANTLSAAEFDAFTSAQQVIAESFGILAGLNLLDLIGPAETATRYRHAAGHAIRLAAVAMSGRMSDLDAEALHAAEDEMAMYCGRLAAAGRLDLIEAAS